MQVVDKHVEILYKTGEYLPAWAVFREPGAAP
jgi:hypothetical protein